jgi:hypothetical protein
MLLPGLALAGNSGNVNNPNVGLTATLGIAVQSPPASGAVEATATPFATATAAYTVTVFNMEATENLTGPLGLSSTSGQTTGASLTFPSNMADYEVVNLGTGQICTPGVSSTGQSVTIGTCAGEVGAGQQFAIAIGDVSSSTTSGDTYTLTVTGTGVEAVPVGTVSLGDEPHVSSVQGSSSLAGGAPVWIGGHGFSGATGVSFGGVQAGFEVLSDSGIWIPAAPLAGQAGPVDVTVSTSSPAYTSRANPADVFTYVAAPVLASVQPSSAPASDVSSISAGAQTAVSLEGSGLTGASEVAFGLSSTATTVAPFAGLFADTDQSVSVAPPEQPVGTVAVSLTATAGTSAAYSATVPLTYDDFPQVDKVSQPSSPLAAGPLQGGQAFSLSGSGFAAATAVKFGNEAVPRFSVVNDASITGTVPAGVAAGPVDVTVTTPTGTSAVNPDDVWFYQPSNGSASLPTVTALGSGPMAGGTPLTISVNSNDGNAAAIGVANVTAVNFGANAVSVTSSETNAGNGTISVPAPAAQSAGTVAITVTTSSGSSTVDPGAVFTYTATPVVSAVQAQPGCDCYNGTTLLSNASQTAVPVVAISGSGLGSVTSVSFPGTSGTITEAITPALVQSDALTISDEFITVPIPTGALPGDVQVTGPSGTSAVNPDDVYGYGTASVPVLSSALGTQGYVGVPGGGDLVEAETYGPQTAAPTAIDVAGATDTTDFSTAALGLTGNGPWLLQDYTPADPGTSPGPAAITVAGSSGSSAVVPWGVWYYGPQGAGLAPVVTGLSQVSFTDPANGGTVQIWVYGSGFAGATDVVVGGLDVPCTSDNDCAVVNDDELYINVPATTPAGTDHITVTTPLGTSEATTDDIVQVASTGQPTTTTTTQLPSTPAGGGGTPTAQPITTTTLVTTTSTTAAPTTTTTRPRAARPMVTALTKKAIVSANAVRLRLLCRLAECQGIISLKHGRVVLGTVSYKLAPDKTGLFLLKLDEKAMDVLATAKSHTLIATETVTVRNGRTVTARVALDG